MDETSWEMKKMGNQILYIKQHFLWLICLTVAVVPMSCKTFMDKKENYTRLHDRVNKIEMRVERLEKINAQSF